MAKPRISCGAKQPQAAGHVRIQQLHSLEDKRAKYDCAIPCYSFRETVESQTALIGLHVVHASDRPIVPFDSTRKELLVIDPTVLLCEESSSCALTIGERQLLVKRWLARRGTALEHHAFLDENQFGTMSEIDDCPVQYRSK